MTFLDRLSRRIGAFPVELPAALLAAGAVGYLTLVAPIPRPAGSSEAGRLLLALACAALTFTLVWFGLRALEPRRAGVADWPRFHHADLHPDAPLRRPIRAGSEFGLPEFDALIDPSPPSPTVALPSFLQPPDTADEPARFVDDVVRGVSDGVVVPRAPVWFRPTQAADDVEYAEWDDAPPAAPEPAPAEEPTPPPPAAAAEESVAALMARLEAGLARQRPPQARPAPDAETRAALRAVADELRAMAR